MSGGVQDRVGLGLQRMIFRGG